LVDAHRKKSPRSSWSFNADTQSRTVASREASPRSFACSNASKWKGS